jgi:ferrous iron transport protein A
MKALIDIKEGEKVYVCSITCGRGLKHRLCTLGILNGQTIEVKKNDTKGPIIVKAMGSSIAIGRGQAGKIMVKSC